MTVLHFTRLSKYLKRREKSEAHIKTEVKNKLTQRSEPQSMISDRSERKPLQPVK